MCFCVCANASVWVRARMLVLTRVHVCEWGRGPGALERDRGGLAETV